jgi:hypothetical protein
MPTILESVQAKRDANVKAGQGDPAKGIDPDHTPAQKTGELARAAITGGVMSVAWKEYMEQFQGLSPDQLKRLLATDGTFGDPGLDLRRAYLVSNGVCGMPSPDTNALDRFVDSIDDTPPVPLPTAFQ